MKKAYACIIRLSVPQTSSDRPGWLESEVRVFQITGGYSQLHLRTYLNFRRFPIMLQVARNTRINDILGGIVSSRTRPGSISSSEAASRAHDRVISLGVTVPGSMHARGVLRDEGLARNQGGRSLLVPTGRKARWSRGRRSRWVLALALGALGVLPAPVSRSLIAAEQPPAAQSGKVPLIYQKKRAFRIPFHIGAQVQARIKEVQLWVSEDAGFHWEPKSRTTPDLGKFTFRTSHDGEFWFATRTVTVDDEFSPPMSQTVEPSMKVVVDSVPPRWCSSRMAGAAARRRSGGKRRMSIST